MSILNLNVGVLGKAEAMAARWGEGGVAEEGLEPEGVHPPAPPSPRAAPEEFEAGVGGKPKTKPTASFCSWMRSSSLSLKNFVTSDSSTPLDSFCFTPTGRVTGTGELRTDRALRLPPWEGEGRDAVLPSA